MPRRGEIWNCYLPNQPDDPHQPCPVMVVSEDFRNDVADDFIVVPIFTSAPLGPTHIAIQEGVGGLPHDSVIFSEEVTCLHIDFFDLTDTTLGGIAPDDLLDEVVKGIRIAIRDYTVLDP